MVCDLHTLCLPLLVPTHLQGLPVSRGGRVGLLAEALSVLSRGLDGVPPYLRDPGHLLSARAWLCTSHTFVFEIELSFDAVHAGSPKGPWKRGVEPDWTLPMSPAASEPSLSSSPRQR